MTSGQRPEWVPTVVDCGWRRARLCQAWLHGWGSAPMPNTIPAWLLKPGRLAQLPCIGVSSYLREEQILHFNLLRRFTSRVFGMVATWTMIVASRPTMTPSWQTWCVCMNKCLQYAAGWSFVIPIVSRTVVCEGMWPAPSPTCQPRLVVLPHDLQIQRCPVWSGCFDGRSEWNAAAETLSSYPLFLNRQHEFQSPTGFSYGRWNIECRPNLFAEQGGVDGNHLRTRRSHGAALLPSLLLSKWLNCSFILRCTKRGSWTKAAAAGVHRCPQVNLLPLVQTLITWTTSLQRLVPL